MILHAPLALLAALFLVTLAVAAPQASLDPPVFGVGTDTELASL
jgi:hypothetical protein